MKTRDVAWFDLFGARGTRRDFIRVAGGVAGLIATGTLAASGGRVPRRLRSDPFTLGVASGDPAPDGVVLWTSLSRDVLEAEGAHRDMVPVDWEVAEDEAFARVVRSGRAAARPELGHSVHVEVEGLRPGRAYFYRLMAGDASTPVARTRTAPATDARPDGLRFAFASCQHYEHGYFTALRHMADEDLDLIVHLGDYIYEDPMDRSEIRQHEGPETLTLEQYRARYRTYKADPDLQAAHRVAPWIVTSDDHEVDNNYANDVAEDGQSPEALLLRRAAAYQAYYEAMPLRRASMPAGPHMRLHRRLRFGDLLELNVLDTRQHRDDQPCGDGRRPSCAEHRRAGRTMLGSAQREWLLHGLGATGAQWNALAQQVLMARLRGPTTERDDTFSMDMWDGYPEERRALLEAVADLGTSNPVVLTGDIHSGWVADLAPDADDPTAPPVATEFAGTSISSSGDGMAMSEGGARMLVNNPHIRFYDGRRGYVRVALTRDLWRSDFRMVPFVTRPGADVRTLATWVVEDGRPGAQRG